MRSLTISGISGFKTFSQKSKELTDTLIHSEIFEYTIAQVYVLDRVIHYFEM